MLKEDGPGICRARVAYTFRDNETLADRDMAAPGYCQFRKSQREQAALEHRACLIDIRHLFHS